VNTIAVSKVGDIAIDIPEATVIIQISSHFGSRRQEAQRLGRCDCSFFPFSVLSIIMMLIISYLYPRILRPKLTNEGEEFNAHFYSLVSSDTQEMYYSSKRQQYLIDQGYSFSMQSDIVPSSFNSKLNNREDELKLLQSVLCSAAVDIEVCGAADVTDQRNGSSVPFLQAPRNISALTGADDDVYFEYSGL
jgi:DNA excision repair protein ERCC-3